MKRILKTMLCFLPWLLSGILFGSNFEFYDHISKPFFALPKGLFFPIWMILYVLIAISIEQVLSNTRKMDRMSYTKSLLANYLFNQLFLLFFFVLKNPFLGFVDTVLVMITSLFLYYETKELNKKASTFLIPYVAYNLYALILSLFVYFMNL